MQRHELIAQNLGRLIEQAGTNPSQLALSVGLGHTAARDILTGKSQNPTDRTLYLLAKGLGVHISQLTGEAPEPRYVHESDSCFIGEVEILTYGPQTADTIKYLAPNVGNPKLFVVLSDAPGFTISVGSFMIVDGDGQPARNGANVVISKPILRGSIRRYGVAQWHAPYLIPSDPQLFGVAINHASLGDVMVEGVEVGSFRLDPGTTESILNGSCDLE